MCAHVAVRFAGGESLRNVGLGGAGQNRHTAAGFIANDLHDAAAFLGCEARKFARGSVGIETVDTAVDEPGDEAAQLGFIDLASCVERNQGRGKDSPQLC